MGNFPRSTPGPAQRSAPLQGERSAQLSEQMFAVCSARPCANMCRVFNRWLLRAGRGHAGSMSSARGHAGEPQSSTRGHAAPGIPCTAPGIPRTAPFLLLWGAIAQILPLNIILMHFLCSSGIANNSHTSQPRHLLEALSIRDW